MTKLVVTSENQIQRLNNILIRIGQLQDLDLSKLISRPEPKAWSIIEIIEHLNRAYQPYQDKIENALYALPEQLHENHPFEVRPWQSFVINSVKPKGQKRKWKIKTLKKFEPVLDRDKLDHETSTAVFNRFEKLHLHLKHSIIESRSKAIIKVKITSAIGSIVSFYLPECFEFLLVHIERHMLQIEEVNQKINCNTHS